ncbi:MAG: hypothetical protein AAB906_00710 [Patescibacteria group bacterium]
MPEENDDHISEEDGIEQMKIAYQDFLRKIKEIEKKRDERIMVIISKIEEREIQKIKKEIKG